MRRPNRVRQLQGGCAPAAPPSCRSPEVHPPPTISCRCRFPAWPRALQSETLQTVEPGCTPSSESGKQSGAAELRFGARQAEQHEGLVGDAGLLVYASHYALQTAACRRLHDALSSRDNPCGRMLCSPRQHDWLGARGGGRERAKCGGDAGGLFSETRAARRRRTLAVDLLPIVVVVPRAAAAALSARAPLRRWRMRAAHTGLAALLVSCAQSQQLLQNPQRRSSAFKPQPHKPRVGVPDLLLQVQQAGRSACQQQLLQARQ